MLIDIVGKNGRMLLNVLQKPDGSIDDESRYLLEELARWFAICGEAIHGTRPWREYAEGDTSVLIEGFKEQKTTWNSSEFRFTREGDTLYAFMLRAPDSRIAVLKSLTEQEKVQSVRLLGSGECPFNQSFGVLTVKLPAELPTAYTNALAITLG